MGASASVHVATPGADDANVAGLVNDFVYDRVQSVACTPKKYLVDGGKTCGAADEDSLAIDYDDLPPLRSALSHGSPGMVLHRLNSDGEETKTNSGKSSQNGSGKHSHSGKGVGLGLKSVKSLRNMALKKHSTQENVYIPSQEIVAEASFMFLSRATTRNSPTGSAMGSVGSNISATDSVHNLNTDGSFKITPKNSGSNLVGALANVKEDAVTPTHAPIIAPVIGGGGKHPGMGLTIVTNSASTDNAVAVPRVRSKPNLQIKVGGNSNINIQDDVDWIQVSDDEGEEEEEKNQKSERLSLSLQGHTAQQSYMLTQSGTIFVDGFQGGGIGKGGIHATGGSSSGLLPLQDRLVVLCRLGAGASGVVYKALDLRDMRMVALKMIPMFDRGKRRQMVRELSALFEVLRQKRLGAEQKEAEQKEQKEQKEQEKKLLEGADARAKASASSGNNGNNGKDSKDSKDSENQNQSKPDATTSIPETHMTNETETQPQPQPQPTTTTFVIPSEVAHNREPNEYIVDFYDAFSNIEEGDVALMMEYMDGGSLQDIVLEGGCDHEPTLASIAAQALVGLSFLHRCSQLHRDLKPGNFLISKRGFVKIADFGILRQMNEESSTQKNRGEEQKDFSGSGTGTGTAVSVSDERLLGHVGYVGHVGHGQGPGGLPALVESPKNGSELSPTAMSPKHETASGEFMPRAQTFVGTATYMSPERIDGREYSYPSDIWSFGLSLLTISLGRLPIDTKGGYWTILHNIRDASPPAVPAGDERFSEDFRDFISECLKKVPEERKTAEELLMHPFLRQTYAEEETEGDEERGIQELRQVLIAASQHLEKRKIDCLKTPQTPNEIAAILPGTLAATFAELTTHETKDLMNRLFSGRPEGYWAALSYQLHLSEEKVVEEINRFLKNFEQSVKFKEQTPLFPPKEGSDSDISTATPKANHSTRR